MRELASAAPQAFAEAAGAPAVAELDHPIPQRLIDLITDRCERCLGLIGSS